MKRMLAGCLLAVFVLAPLRAQAFDPVITIKGGEQDQINVPICVPLQVPKGLALPHVGYVAGHGRLLAQLTPPSLATEAEKASDAKHERLDLHFVVPKLLKGTFYTYKLAFGPELKLARHFLWKEEPGQYSELLLREDGKDRPILRYMSPKFDDSSKDARNKSYKVFHHLYDPQGTRFVTNGGHTDPYDDEKKLTFPHHRGLMFGFNNVSYGPGKRVDTWHCTGDAHLTHEKTLSKVVGPVLARHRVLLAWHGVKKEVFAHEEREVTVYYVPGGTLVDWSNRLKSASGTIKLDGDPQHAGFQFRAANEVAEKTANQTYYLRPDGKDKPGATRNWDQKNKTHVNLPWNAMSFVLGKQRYTVAYLDHPKNPREARHSERNYGRFGYYFVHELTPEQPLQLNYRLWLQEGEMTGPQVQALRDVFVTGPEITVTDARRN